MELNDLLRKQGIDPSQVIVMRHRPIEPGLRKVLPWLVHEQPNIFNAYQQNHAGAPEAALEKLVGKGWLASFIGIKPGEAVFAGVYQIHGAVRLSREEYWSKAENQILKSHGMIGWTKEHSHALWFDLQLQPPHCEWIGKLSIAWPPPERSWWRRAERNEMPILSITEESQFTGRMPGWQDLVLSWAELGALPSSWASQLKEWRGIYFIHDVSDGKGYVGSACGADNLLGRWLVYAKGGDGGNKLLLQRDPSNLRFSILQRVSPDLSPAEVVAMEVTWKKRLHTRAPHGLNAN